MNQLELLEHMLENVKADRVYTHGLVFDNGDKVKYVNVSFPHRYSVAPVNDVFTTKIVEAMAPAGMTVTSGMSII